MQEETVQVEKEEFFSATDEQCHLLLRILKVYRKEWSTQDTFSIRTEGDA